MNKGLTDFQYFYFIGIGGIGMSALARWLFSKQKNVAGYDRTHTHLCQQLKDEGIEIHFADQVESIPKPFLNNQDTLVVYTPAIPQDHLELNYFKNNGFTIVKRSELLGWITKDKFTIGVAGTHGKTTTSTLLAHLLKTAQCNVTAFLGGIATNYQNNLILSEIEKEEILVVEADEFDRSFLRLNPKMAIITSTDADHLDIYQSKEVLIVAYQSFANLVSDPSCLFVNEKVELDKSNCLTYGFLNAHYKAFDVSYSDYRFKFSIQTPEAVLKDLELGMPGFHNVENCTAAIAVALKLGVSEPMIRQGLSSFRGISRRFEFIHKGAVVYIDDYAHHPSEIEAFIKSVKALFTGRHLTVVFQPHLFSRTRDFMEGFAQSLALADRAILLDIYPAREQPIEGVSSQTLLQKIPNRHCQWVSDAELLTLLENSDLDVLATIGAGNIDRFVPEIAEIVKKR